MYQVYINQSVKSGRYYVGHSKDALERLRVHNAGKVRSTKSGIPWSIIWVEQHETKQSAYRREMQIKRFKGGEAFKHLVNQFGEVA